MFKWLEEVTINHMAESYFEEVHRASFAVDADVDEFECPTHDDNCCGLESYECDKCPSMWYFKAKARYMLHNEISAVKNDGVYEEFMD